MPAPAEEDRGIFGGSTSVSGGSVMAGGTVTQVAAPGRRDGAPAGESRQCVSGAIDAASGAQSGSSVGVMTIGADAGTEAEAEAGASL